MGKLRTISSTIRIVDSRAVKPMPKVADKELQSPEYRQWAEQVKRRAAYQCEAIDDGKRCQVAAPSRLFADHIHERKDGGALLDLDNGQCLCASHHTRKTAAARASRMAQRFDRRG